MIDCIFPNLIKKEKNNKVDDFHFFLCTIINKSL